MKKKKFSIFGVEDVYDAFDEFEHSNSLTPFSIEASSLEQARSLGEELVQRKINEERFKSGFVSSIESCSGPHGSYFGRVVKILNAKGKTIFKRNER